MRRRSKIGNIVRDRTGMFLMYVIEIKEIVLGFNAF